MSDGHGVHLATARDYGDFELYVDWLMVSPNGDSGIYLRSFPQVQIWDPVQSPRSPANGAAKGSGALWNNNPDNPGRFPLVKADNPVGQWNTLRIRMVGTKVWIWLNGKQTVDGQVLDNYFDRAQPILPRGPIELQTHGSEIRFRNVFVKELDSTPAHRDGVVHPTTLSRVIGRVIQLVSGSGSARHCSTVSQPGPEVDLVRPSLLAEPREAAAPPGTPTARASGPLRVGRAVVHHGLVLARLPEPGGGGAVDLRRARRCEA